MHSGFIGPRTPGFESFPGRCDASANIVARRIYKLEKSTLDIIIIDVLKFKIYLRLKLGKRYEFVTLLHLLSVWSYLSNNCLSQAFAMYRYKTEDYESSL